MKRLVILLLFCSVTFAQGTPVCPYMSTWIRTLFDDETQATAQTTLGLGTGDSPTWAGATITNCAVLGSDSAVFQPNANSTTFYQILDADGGTPVFNVDSDNERIGFFNNAPTSDISFGKTLNDITTDTADGSDNKAFRFSGGGEYGYGRGASFQFFGNEYPTYGGSMYFDAGNTDGVGDNHGGLFFRIANSQVFIIPKAGSISVERNFVLGTNFAIQFEDSGGTNVGNMIEFYNDDLYISTRKAGADLILRSNGTSEKMRITSGGNILMNTTSAGTGSPVGILSIKAGTHPTVPAADCATFFVEDVVAGTAEMRVMDEAGNESTLSPHNFSLFEPDKDHEYPWSYYASNAFIGKEINVDMYGAIKCIEELSGRQFIYTRDIPKEDWIEQRTELEEKRQLNEEVEVTLAEAVEDVNETEQGVIGKEKAFKFENGKIVEYEKDVMGDVLTGKMAKRLKPGTRLDETTGKLYRKKTKDEVIIDPESLKKLPKWIGDRAIEK